MRIISTAFVIASCLLAPRAEAQAPPPNAALRYWMAFAVMKDPPDEKFGVTAEQVDRIAAAAAAWDEAALGKLVDDNRGALAIMQRASALQSCDWGLEYELGPFTPIAHLAKARVLGRLNGLAAARLAARGDWQRAVDTWMAGVHFSQHVAQGGSLISALSAGVVLKASVNGLVAAANQSSVDAARRAQMAAVVRALPEEEFDWSAAMLLEEQTVVSALGYRFGPRHPEVLKRMPSASKVQQLRDEARADREHALAALQR